MATGNCPTCGRIRENNPGDYYHEKSCKASQLVKMLAMETDQQKIKKLKYQLELARYVGD